LEGLFQHPAHCKDFITTAEGLIRIGNITSLPCLPYDFANSVASDSLVQVMRTLTEVATYETVQHLSKLLQISLKDTEEFWVSPGSDSQLLPMLDISGTFFILYGLASFLNSIIRCRGGSRKFEVQKFGHSSYPRYIACRRLLGVRLC
jgi:hypothetical protein